MLSNRIACLVAGALTVAPTAAAGQDPPFQIEVGRAEAAPEIDGLVGDQEWAGSGSAGDFIQFEPLRGRPAEERTEVFVLQDDEAIYVAFRVWDSQVPTAQLTRRDADLFADDAVVLLLDTHLDHQSGYLFLTNLLGAQTDGRVANDGRTVDHTWDATWESAAQRTDWGWSAEMAIPLSSIRYTSGEDRTWGVNFGRSLRRSLAVSFWAGPLENRLRVSQAGQLTGLHLPTPPRNTDVIVYGLSRVAEGMAADWDGGVDARYNPTPDITLNATANPDFATVEADQEVVNLTRFEVSLTEKRPFFLEGSELFRQRIRTFYTRRISDIRGGGKVLGKRGPWTFAMLGAGTDSTGDLSSAFYGVTRVQRDIGRSSLAATWADRHRDGAGSGSVGLDATLFFSARLGFTGQLIQSYGEFDDGTMAFFLRPSYDSPTGHVHLRFTHLGDRFADNANGIGFIRDDNRRELDSAIEKTLWFEKGALEQFSYESNYNIYWGQDGTRRSWQIDEGVSFEFRNRWSLELSHAEEFKLFEKEFRNRATSIDVGYNTREFRSISSEVEFGRNFDSDFLLVSTAARIKPTPASSLEYELERLTLDPDPDRESTWIHVVRGSQFFTPDLFVQFFLQSNSVIDRREAQVVFVYRYKPPFGSVQLVFQRGGAEFGERSEQGNTVFLKGTWVP